MAKFLTVLLALLLIGSTASAQFESYTMVDVGSYVKTHAKSAAAFRFQIEIPNYTDTTSGVTMGERTGIFYADTKDDIQGASVFFYAKKSVGLLGAVDLYALFGGGVLYEITDGNDPADAALKFELGGDIYKKLGFQVGADMVPIRGGEDEYFLYAGINLTPSIRK